MYIPLHVTHYITRRFFFLQQSEGSKFTTILCPCIMYICLFCVILRFICTRRPVPYTRVFKVAPEVKAYLDRANDLIQSGAILPGACDEYLYEFEYYERNVTHDCNRVHEYNRPWEKCDGKETFKRYIPSSCDILFSKFYIP